MMDNVKEMGSILILWYWESGVWAKGEEWGGVEQEVECIGNFNKYFKHL
jgi:hypothetical protein